MADNDKPSTDAPKLEYPCDYPIKVMGEAAEDFKELVVTVVRKHAPELNDERVTLRESKAGNYYSVTVTIVATGEAQIMAIFEDLKKTGRVKMVL